MHRSHTIGFLMTAVLLLAPLPLAAGSGDGRVVGRTKILDNGPSEERVDLVLPSEGYRESELVQFATDAQSFVDALFATPPFDRYQRAFNVWRLDVASDESGADDPAPPPDDPDTSEDESRRCGGGTGATARTFFDASFCADGLIRRLLSVGVSVSDTLDAQVPGWEQALVIVNSNIYGGAGGRPGTTSLNGNWQLIATHEFGHSGYQLADEYSEFCATPPADFTEPSNVNATLVSDPTLIKWRDFIAPGSPLPTTTNPACASCVALTDDNVRRNCTGCGVAPDPAPDPAPGSVVVGLYEGGARIHCQAYRPVHGCMMSNYSGFCPVCTRRIEDTLNEYLPPNTPPTCAAGGPYLAECQGVTQVALDGNGSSDAEGDALAFTWTGGFATGTATGSPVLVSFTGRGSFPVSLSVSDGTELASCGTTVTVQDTVAPNLGAAAPVGAECTSPAGAPVSLPSPAVSEGCDASPTLTNDAPGVLPLGTTTVTWTATDDSGHRDTSSQTVTVVDTTAPVVQAPADIAGAECASASGTAVALGNASATDVCDPTLAIANDAPARFPLGTTIVTWTATDDGGNPGADAQSVTVVDRTPPSLGLTVSPAVLWPPDHKLREVVVGVSVSDTCDPAPRVRLVSVTSSEPEDGSGDGHTQPDVVGTQIGSDDRSFSLRAERSGHGTGRVYTITYAAEDASGNATLGQTTVTVPHDMR